MCNENEVSEDSGKELTLRLALDISVRSYEWIYGCLNEIDRKIGNMMILSSTLTAMIAMSVPGHFLVFDYRFMASVLLVFGIILLECFRTLFLFKYKRVIVDPEKMLKECRSLSPREFMWGVVSSYRACFNKVNNIVIWKSKHCNYIVFLFIIEIGILMFWAGYSSKQH